MGRYFIQRAAACRCAFSFGVSKKYIDILGRGLGAERGGRFAQRFLEPVINIGDDMESWDRAAVEKFFSAIAPWEDAYINSGFSYFAVKKDGEQLLLNGRLFLHVLPPNFRQRQFESAQVLAGYFSLAELEVGAREFVEQFTETGEINTPAGILKLPQVDRRISASFVSFELDAASVGNRLPILYITAAQRDSYLNQPQLDWDLKAALMPFDSLSELLNEYSLMGNSNNLANIEVLATPVSYIDLSSSISGEEAKIVIGLAKCLDTDKCHVGYRALLHGKVEARAAVSGKDMAWSEDAGLHKGGRA